MFEFHETPKGAIIKVIGAGGGGCNAVRNMINAKIEGVEFYVANTDAQVLKNHPCTNRLHLGQKITKGLGAGGNPEIGMKAAIEDQELINNSLRGADIVFVTAGLGGGTGSGAAPVIAAAARELKALTVAVVTLPFSWEGTRRKEFAEAALKNLISHVDSYIVVENDRLRDEKKILLTDAFIMADDALRQGIQSIINTIHVPGLINRDCNDVRAIMQSMGLALMGIGIASGENRAMEALNKALKGPLMADANLEGAFGVLYTITCGNDFLTEELQHIGDKIIEYTGTETNIYYGLNVDETITDGSLKVVVIATGINQKKQKTFSKFAKSEPITDIIAKRAHSIRKADNFLNNLDGSDEDRYQSPTYLRKQLD